MMKSWFPVLLSVFVVSRVLGQSDGSIGVCPHLDCARATVIQVTDKFYPATWLNFQGDSRKYGSTWAEFLALEHNIPLHVFEHEILGPQFSEFIEMGRGGCSMYYPSCDLSYQTDFLEKALANLSTIYGRRPTTISYGCGKTGYAALLPEYILGGRRSEYTAWDAGKDGDTWYGEGFGIIDSIDYSTTEHLLTRACTGRFYTDVFLNAEREEAMNFVVDQVQKTLQSQGFYLNFMHWHNRRDNGTETVEATLLMKPFFKALTTGIGTDRIAKVDYNGAVEYLYAKEAVERVTLQNLEDTVMITLHLSQIRDADYSVIKTPVTLRIDRASIGSKYLNPNHGRISSIHCDEEAFYVNVVPDFNRPFDTIKLEKVSEPNCRPIELPRLLVEESGYVLSDQPVKFTLFQREKEAPEYAVEIAGRILNPQHSHTFEGLDHVRYDYFVSAINRKKESVVTALPEPGLVDVPIHTDQLRIKIFPNLSTGPFNVLVDPLPVEGIKMEVYTVHGVLVLNDRLTTPQSEFNTALPQGTYLVKFKSADSWKTEKLIIR